MQKDKNDLVPPSSDREQWISFWNNVDQRPHVQTNGTNIEQDILEDLIKSTIDKITAVSLRAAVNPMDDTLLRYSINWAKHGKRKWIIAPEFSATPIQVDSSVANDNDSATIFLLQTRIDEGAIIPDGTQAISGQSELQSLDDRTCRLLRIHQARLELGLSVSSFCGSLNISESYYCSMMKLNKQIVSLDRIAAYLEASRALLQKPASTQRSATNRVKQ